MTDGRNIVAQAMAKNVGCW